jgi:hypothetical protein
VRCFVAARGFPVPRTVSRAGRFGQILGLCFNLTGILRTPDADEVATSALLPDATLHPKEYLAVHAPALAFTPRHTMQNWFFYLDPIADSVKWRAAEHWLTKVVQPWLDRSACVAALNYTRNREVSRDGMLQYSRSVCTMTGSPRKTQKATASQAVPRSTAISLETIPA